MQFLVRYFPEITIKSKPVRLQMSQQLTTNLIKVFRHHGIQARVLKQWDNIRVEFEHAEQSERIADVLRHTPGIDTFSLMREHSFTDLHDIYEKTADYWGDKLASTSFRLFCKRVGKHDFTSPQVCQYVGGGLNQNFETGGVDLHNPDQLIRIEIRHDKLFVYEFTERGIGGFPLGTQDSVLSLISGGFDSAVSSYMTTARGIKTHFLFFNLGGSEHEIGVKEVAYYLWDKFGSSHRIKFITVNFEDVVEEILTKVSNAQMGVVLKRMFMRAASQVCDIHKAHALVTGEAIAQVSSQTLANLAMIDQVTDHLVLRPLITTNKSDIINIARQIGTEDFSASMPEYCGVISVKPTTHARQHKIDAEEAKFDFDILQRAIDNAKVSSIEKLAERKRSPEEGAVAELYADVPADAIVVDIRHPDEEELNPLEIGSKTLHIPFYKLHKASADFEKEQHYLLYCAHGVMSRMHAQYLRDNGVHNIDVYRPES